METLTITRKFNNAERTRQAAEATSWDYVGHYHTTEQARKKCLSLEENGTTTFYKPIRKQENLQTTTHYYVYSFEIATETLEENGIEVE